VIEQTIKFSRKVAGIAIDDDDEREENNTGRKRFNCWMISGLCVNVAEKSSF
jgi:hypothetical protein